MTHSLVRSIGWHLGTVLVDALGPAAILIAVVLLALYVVARFRKAR